MFRYALLLLFLVCVQDTAWSVRVIEVRVPAHAHEGGTALLGCQYDLEGEQLYSLKWYKDSQEFYRYLPRSNINVRTYDRPGVFVNKIKSSSTEKSFSTEVVLENLTRDSEGEYACEVSGEAPRFDTVRSVNYITIHLLPESGPHVTGLKEQYGFGDEVNANCTSTASRPEAHLKWLVNDIPAPVTDLGETWSRVSQTRPDARETILQLHFKVEARHFVGSSMRLKCQATIVPLYQRETSSTHYIRLQSLDNDNGFIQGNFVGIAPSSDSSLKRPMTFPILLTVLSTVILSIF